jgi:hypothetical protein
MSVTDTGVRAQLNVLHTELLFEHRPVTDAAAPGSTLLYKRTHTHKPINKRRRAHKHVPIHDRQTKTQAQSYTDTLACTVGLSGPPSPPLSVLMTLCMCVRVACVFVCLCVCVCGCACVQHRASGPRRPTRCCSRPWSAMSWYVALSRDYRYTMACMAGAHTVSSALVCAVLLIALCGERGSVGGGAWLMGAHVCVCAYACVLVPRWGWPIGDVTFAGDDGARAAPVHVAYGRPHHGRDIARVCARALALSGPGPLPLPLPGSPGGHPTHQPFRSASVRRPPSRDASISHSGRVCAARGPDSGAAAGRAPWSRDRECESAMGAGGRGGGCAGGRGRPGRTLGASSHHADITGRASQDTERAHP